MIGQLDPPNRAEGAIGTMATAPTSVLWINKGLDFSLPDHCRTVGDAVSYAASFIQVPSEHIRLSCGVTDVSGDTERYLSYYNVSGSNPWLVRTRVSVSVYDALHTPPGLPPCADGALLCRTALQTGAWQDELDQVRSDLRSAGVSVLHRLLVSRTGTTTTPTWVDDGDGVSVLRGTLGDLDLFLVPDPRLIAVSVSVPPQYRHGGRPTTVTVPI